MLLANAGILLYEPLLDLDWDKLRRIVDVNLVGTIAALDWGQDLIRCERSGGEAAAALVEDAREAVVGEREMAAAEQERAAVTGHAQGVVWRERAEVNAVVVVLAAAP